MRLNAGLSIGKNPKKAEGYAHETVKRRMYRLDKCYRYIWKQRGSFTVDTSPEEADEWMRHLALTDNS